ncbi:hypothetical protein HYALB_00004120 [Hymenoscyphus albidus]|uniref:Cellular morphogenesis protein n=1 Tax=Hymenoscyphus albidus TaxID=595503 RepID=A0A9N9LLA6_9HELO|nr:hypothetical protein HYALB_00004120 [Hymenoscyphus albidus]
MRLSSWWSSVGDLPLLLRHGLLLACITPLGHAITFKSIPSDNLDLSKLGRVGLAGDFDSISLYQFEGQSQDSLGANRSSSILTRFPNGAFDQLAASDATIEVMCSFVLKSGTLAGVVVGGDFTSLGGKNSPGAAMYDPNTSTITPLTGLSGKVTALLCDSSSDRVYVGGAFKGANSSNAMVWVNGQGWNELPFKGFNGPVTSISKASNGHIIFGGSFTGLGNTTTPKNPDQQIINISGADITAVASTATTGLSDPRNIVCKTSGTDGPDNTWLLADNAQGFWKASFGFGFQPTKLRLYNTHLDGRGTKTWRFTAQPINGILNFTYIDPATGQNASCSSECPLSDNSTLKFQDFHFVNVIGMNGFQIDISAFYGKGGGLNGIEFFEDEIYSYAINKFNEPTCAGVQIASSASATGPWAVTPSGASASEYLTAAVGTSTEATVIFKPDIKQSGNYSVNIYTPGCNQDDSCSSRGRVNVSGIMSTGDTNSKFNTEIFQTNLFDKYDQIFFGYIEAGSSSFQASITLSPSEDQNNPNLKVVAQRVSFALTSPSTGGLNNIFEFDPTKAMIDASDFANSTFDKAGISIGVGSGVNTLATSDTTTFVGGNFSTDAFQNILAITDSGATALAGGSLNGEVLTAFVNGSSLYVGGNFTNTNANNVNGLGHVAVYDTLENTWASLGAGVNGTVTDVVPISLNVTENVTETVITVTGDFSQIIGFGGNPAIAVSGFAVWIPSQNNWLQNVKASTSVTGKLMAALDLPDGGSLFAGFLSSSQFNSNGVVQLSSPSGTASLSTFPVAIKRNALGSPSSFTKRATAGAIQNVTGVVTGLFYENGTSNITILGGHFTATGTSGSDINNLLFINNSNADTVTGVGSQINNDSTILALAIMDDTLWAGGFLSGNVNDADVNGLFSYNLKTSAFGTQPPALSGTNAAVKAIAVRPGTTDIYVGGSFSSAGSLQCPGVCVFTTSATRWDRPGSNLGGTAHAMMWQSPTSLIIAGELVINGGNASVATYDTKSQNWTMATGANTIPGPVTTMTTANNDGTELWVGGIASNGSTFLMKFDGTIWNPVGDVFGSGTNIQSLEVLPLSQNHGGTDLLSSNQALMITGSLNVPGFGNASAVIFNGTTFQPFALTSSYSKNGGSISQIFHAKKTVFSAARSRIARGFVVLIALAIALGLIFLLVVAGVVAERIRRKRDGYMPAPTSSYDNQNKILESRIPPEQLFGSLGQGRSGVEKQSTRI